MENINHPPDPSEVSGNHRASQAIQIERLAVITGQLVSETRMIREGLTKLSEKMSLRFRSLDEDRAEKVDEFRRELETIRIDQAVQRDRTDLHRTIIFGIIGAIGLELLAFIALQLTRWP